MVPSFWQFPLDQKLCEHYIEITCTPSRLRINLSAVKIDVDSKFHPELQFKRFFVSSTDPGPQQICAAKTTKCLEILNVSIHAVGLI